MNTFCISYSISLHLLGLSGKGAQDVDAAAKLGLLVGRSGLVLHELLEAVNLRSVSAEEPKIDECRISDRDAPQC